MEDDQFYTDAVLYCYTEITENMHYDNIIGHLISQYIVTISEKQDLDSLQIGSISRCRKLVDLIFTNKRNMKNFVEALRICHEPLALHVEEQRAKIKSGKSPGHLQVIQQHVKSEYKKNDGNIIEKLPGEKFTLDISDDSQLMPLDISAEIRDEILTQKISRRMHSKSNSFEYKYLSKQLDCVEDIFVNEEFLGDRSQGREKTSKPSRLVICTGIAGTGKSVTLCRLAWQWSANLNARLKEFDFVFLIPLANIDMDQSIVDILSSEGRKGLGLIDGSHKQTIHQHLILNGDRILFALDGGDEIDIPENSEIRKLISGELYSKARVIFTIRSGTSFIQNLKPDVKIHINGTNKEGMYKHIKSSLLNTNINNEKEVELILALCRKFTSNIDMLYIPLYLTLFTILFNQHWVKYASLAHFTVPTTMTALFNSFMSVIIKIWLKRLRRKEEANTCVFTRSPLEKEGHVPVDICAKLFNMGRMSFEFLLERRHTFTGEDFRYYFIDINDVVACGMFCMTNQQDNGSDSGMKRFRFKHQTFQEYLTALYLSHVKFKDALFRDHVTAVDKPISKSLKKLPQKSLEEIFAPLQESMKFLFGISPEFGMEILVKTLPNVGCVVRSKTLTVLDLLYESLLYTESKRDAFVEIMETHLGKVNFINRHFDLNKYTTNFGVVDSFIKKLSPKICKVLLHKVYNLEVVASTSDYSTLKQYPKSQKLVLINLDTTTYSLLLHFKFPYTSVSVEKSMVFDVQSMQRIFPKVKNLVITGKKISNILVNDMIENQEGETVDKLSRGLTTVELYSHVVASSLPCSAICSLLDEQNLQVLHLHQVDIFEYAPQYDYFSPKWENLVQLTISSGDMYEEYYPYLKKILSTTNRLKNLHLNNSYGETCGENKASDLMETLGEHLQGIEQLSLIHTFNQQGVETMCRYISSLKDLKQLGLGEWDIMDLPEECFNLLSQSTIKELKVHLWHFTKDSMKNKCHKITESNIIVSFKD